MFEQFQQVKKKYYMQTAVPNESETLTMVVSSRKAIKLCNFGHFIRCRSFQSSISCLCLLCSRTVCRYRRIF